MELDQLRYFLRVSDRGNFTRAAEDLMISQPALSRSIQKLEEELGQPVFERKTRSVALTDAGTLLQARAQQVLSIIEDTKAEITDDGESGRIRIGAIPTIAPYFLPDVLRRFAEEFPKAAVTVQESTTDSLLKSCTQGKLTSRFLPCQSRRNTSKSKNCLKRSCSLSFRPIMPWSGSRRFGYVTWSRFRSSFSMRLIVCRTTSSRFVASVLFNRLPWRRLANWRWSRNSFPCRTACR